MLLSHIRRRKHREKAPFLRADQYSTTISRQVREAYPDDAQKVRLQVPHGAGDAGKLRAAEAKVRCAEHGHHAKAAP